MFQLVAFRLQVAACKDRRRNDQRNMLQFAAKSVLTQSVHLLRVICEQSDLALGRYIPKLEDRSRSGVGAHVDYVAACNRSRCVVCVVTTPLLEHQSSELEVNAHTTTVLSRNTNYCAFAFLIYALHCGDELLAAFTGPVEVYLARGATGVDAKKKGGRLSEDWREVRTQTLACDYGMVVPPNVIYDEVHLMEVTVRRLNRTNATSRDRQLHDGSTLSHMNKAGDISH